jgi:hypothetical protein
MVLGKVDIYMYKTESRSLPLTLYKNHVETDLCVRSDTLKLLEESIEKTFQDIGNGSNFN